MKTMNPSLNSKLPHACRLCGVVATLRKSHIIPAAAHVHTKIGGLNVLIGNRKNTFRRQNQTDFKEPMLCSECETMLSVFEERAISVCREAFRHRSDASFLLSPDAVEPLVAFAYSVFWRSSIALSMEGYRLNAEWEDELRDAFYKGIYPPPPRLAISMSFLKVLDIPMTGRIIMTPLVARLAGQVEVHYFSIFGIVFRMHVPNSFYELEQNEFLRVEERSGCIYPLQHWEERLIDGELTHAAVLAKMEDRALNE